MSLKKQAVSGVKWTGISSVVTVGSQFLQLAVLARLLVPEDFGLIAMVMVILGFAQVYADMGISAAIIHRQDIIPKQLSSLYWLNIIAGVVIFALVIASTPLIVQFYGEPRLFKLIYLSALVFLITPLGQQFQILLQKELRFKSLARIEMLSALIQAVISISAAVAGCGVFSLIYGQLGNALSRTLCLVTVGWREWKPMLYFNRKDLNGFLGFGLYQMGERSINYFNLNLDYLLIGLLLGAKSLGFYTLAYNLILRPSLMINLILTRVAFPIFSKVQNDVGRLKRGYLKVLQLLSSVNFPIMTGLAVVAPVAVPIIFGKQWIPSVILIQILTIVGLLRSVANPIGSLLLARGRADLGFKWNLSLMATTIPGLYFGAKLGGLVGVAVAFACLMVVYITFGYIILIRTLLGSCLREYISSMWPSLWISILMAVTVLCVQILSQGLQQHFSLLIQILFGVGVFCGLMIHSQRSLVCEIKEMLWNKKL